MPLYRPTACDKFVIDDRYSRHRFQRIIPDIGAAAYSTAGKDQFLALQREDPSVTLNVANAGYAQVKFGEGGTMAFIGSTDIKTPFGLIRFHMLETFTFFCSAWKH
jgi:hypothetical protein